MRRRPRRPRRQGPVEREGGRAVLLIVLVVAVMTGSGYVAAYAGADGKLPTGTRVGGVDVGGRDPQQAAHALSAGLADRLRAPMTLMVGDRTYQVTPVQAGLSVDYLGSVERALGRRSWDPARLWTYYTGGDDYAPSVTVDESRMGDLLDHLDGSLGVSTREGAISLTGGTIHVTQPRAGATIDHPAAVQAIRDAWSTGEAQVQLPLRVTQPTVTTAQLQAAVQQLANPALAAPVTLRFDHSRVILTPSQYASMLTIAPHAGQLTLDVVGTDLTRLVDPSAHDTRPRDAMLRLGAAGVRVVKAHAGHTYDGHDVVTAFLAAVDATGDQRTVTVPGDATPAAFTTHDAKALGVTSPVASYSVRVPRSAGGSLATAVARLSGTLVRPGDTFSFEQSVGDAGGLASRLATATWNAGFLAGLTDVARTAPSTSAPASPVGRDVAVGSGTDLSMRDDTAAGVLLEARLSGRTLTVDAWSSPQYAVTAAVGAPYDVVPRSTVTDPSPGCRASAGADGFTVDLTRTFASLVDPAQTRSDVVTTTYQPQPVVVCALHPLADVGARDYGAPMRIPGPVRPVVVLIAALSAVLPTAAATGASRSAPVSAGHHAQPGALSWHDVPTGTSERFRGLSPVSRRVAWVSGTHGTVLRTTDAGRTWQDVSPGQHNQNAEFRDIEAIDADTAVVLAIGPGRKSRIYRTDDAGQTWTRGFVNTDPAAFYDCMGFWNAKRGVAVSDPVDGKFRVIRTDDGGRSWSVVDPAGMPAALPGEFGFAASGTCLVTAGAQDAWIASGGGATARVFHSTDRGDHWTVADTPVASSDAGGIFSLAVRHRDDLVAVGGDYLSPEQTTHTSAYSLDAGATWAPGGDLGGYRSGSAWLPLPHGVVAVGPTGSDVSFDGGVSWSPVDSGSLDSVQCTRDGACWGSGNLGRVAVLRGLR